MGFFMDSLDSFFSARIAIRKRLSEKLIVAIDIAIIDAPSVYAYSIDIRRGAKAVLSLLEKPENVPMFVIIVLNKTVRKSTNLGEFQFLPDEFPRTALPPDAPMSIARNFIRYCP